VHLDASVKPSKTSANRLKMSAKPSEKPSVAIHGNKRSSCLLPLLKPCLTRDSLEIPQIRREVGQVYGSVNRHSMQLAPRMFTAMPWQGIEG
jgi:hypothetical protein